MGSQEKEPTAVDVTAVWGLPLIAVHCPRCGEAHLVPEDAIPPRCPLCFQGVVAPQPAFLREEPPEQILPYRVSKRGLSQVLDKWTRGIWFRPAELRAEVLAKRLRPYLIPLWLVDGQIEGAWRADVGFDYQVVSYQDRYKEGHGWSSREVEETRAQWEPRAGRINLHYDNLVAPALDDHREMAKKLGAFDLDQRTDYDSEAISGASVRIPPLTPEAAWPGAEVAFVRAAEADSRHAAGADHIRNFALEAEYSDLNWTLLLLPAFTTWYKEGDQIWPLLINGQNGRVSGVRRASTRRATTAALILGGVGLLLFLIGGLLSLLGAIFPPAAVLGGLILVAGLLLAVSAPIPPIGAWVFNRRNS